LSLRSSTTLGLLGFRGRCRYCTCSGLFVADYERGNHAAARADIGQLGERKPRKRRFYLAIKQQRIKVYQLFRKLESAVWLQGRKCFASCRHTFLNQIVANFQSL